MKKYNSSRIPKTDRITRLVELLYKKMPEIESARAVLVTESYKQTENEPLIIRRQANRECIGIVTKIDLPDANIPLADRWLEIAGCTKIFHVNSLKGEGMAEILDYLKEDND